MLTSYIKPDIKGLGRLVSVLVYTEGHKKVSRYPPSLQKSHIVAQVGFLFYRMHYALWEVALT